MEKRRFIIPRHVLIHLGTHIYYKCLALSVVLEDTGDGELRVVLAPWHLHGCLAFCGDEWGKEALDSIVFLFVNPNRNLLLIGPHSFSRLDPKLFPKPTIQHLQPWADPRSPNKRQDIEPNIRSAER